MIAVLIVLMAPLVLVALAFVLVALRGSDHPCVTRPRFERMQAAARRTAIR